MMEAWKCWLAELMGWVYITLVGLGFAVGLIVLIVILSPIWVPCGAWRLFFYPRKGGRDVKFLDGPLRGQTRKVSGGAKYLEIPVLDEPIVCVHVDDPTFNPDPDWTPRFGKVIYRINGDMACVEYS